VKKKQQFDYDVTVVIMGGGAGTRLAPLTSSRAKPAVPLAGKFRLIDIPISNCINSGYNRIYVLTQFNSMPLNRHIQQSYHFHRFSRGFVEILAAQQTPDDAETRGREDDQFWFRGTADAVRKCLGRLEEADGSEVLILSGDQIYQMDFRHIIGTHRGDGATEGADVTLGAVLVSKERSRDLGVLRVNSDGDVVAFVEKPGYDESKYDGLEATPELLEKFGVDPKTGPWYLANMGIYVFEYDILKDSLNENRTYDDFGKEILPSLLGKKRFRAHIFDGYWEDIGTVGAFHEANLDLASEQPAFNFFNPDWPIYTRARLLPASRTGNTNLTNSAIADGCIVEGATIEDSLLGIRSIVRDGVTLRRTYVMGADEYETEADRISNQAAGVPDIGIGPGTVIENAIVDKDCRIGRDVRLVNEAGVENFKQDGCPVIVRDGVICVPRRAVVPDGFVLKAEKND